MVQDLDLAVTHQQLFPTVSYQQLFAQTNWQKLFLHDVHLNVEPTLFFFTDSFGFADSPVFLIQPNPSDSVVFEDTQAFSSSLGKTDALPLVDSASMHPTRALSDSYGFADTQAIDASKALSDSVSMQESLTTLLTFIRSFTDDAVLQESAAFSSATAKSDSFLVADAPAFGSGKTASDSFGFADSSTAHLTRVVHEDTIDGSDFRFRMIDQPSFVRNPGNWQFIINNETESFDVSGTPADSFSFTDSEVLSITKVVTDYFSLDDFSQIDKDFSGVKTNVYTMQDQHQFALSKAVADSIIMGESTAFAVAVPASDSFNISDTTLLSTGKGLSDSVSIEEAVDLALLSASAEPNRGLVGFMLLNAD